MSFPIDIYDEQKPIWKECEILRISELFFFVKK